MTFFRQSKCDGEPELVHRRETETCKNRSPTVGAWYAVRHNIFERQTDGGIEVVPVLQGARDIDKLLEAKRPNCWSDSSAERLPTSESPSPAKRCYDCSPTLDLLRLEP